MLRFAQHDMVPAGGAESFTGGAESFTGGAESFTGVAESFTGVAESFTGGAYGRSSSDSSLPRTHLGLLRPYIIREAV